MFSAAPPRKVPAAAWCSHVLDLEALQMLRIVRSATRSGLTDAHPSPIICIVTCSSVRLGRVERVSSKSGAAEGEGERGEEGEAREQVMMVRGEHVEA